MKYYVVADVHGFYTELRQALTEKGFFHDTDPHRLVVCGDLFDRGREALGLQAFIAEGMERGEVILIRGNHEDLMEALLQDWENFGYMRSHHRTNGTVDTVLQLTESPILVGVNAGEVKRKLLQTPFIRDMLPQMQDYCETAHYIFVHGWIPCEAYGPEGQESRFFYRADWRDAGAADWARARWYNGMEAAREGVTEPHKTIVCGHWHTSYGHARIEGVGSELGADADFSPYRAAGIIALDACTARSHRVNCVVIEDEPLHA